MPRLDEELIHNVVRLDREGMKWRAIARALRISRNTVRKIMEEHQEARHNPHRAAAALGVAQRQGMSGPAFEHGRTAPSWVTSNRARALRSWQPPRAAE